MWRELTINHDEVVVEMAVEEAEASQAQVVFLEVWTETKTSTQELKISLICGNILSVQTSKYVALLFGYASFSYSYLLLSLCILL